MRRLLLPLASLALANALAQGDLAYMPAAPPARTADDAAIALHETGEPGTVRFDLPAGTYLVDLLNGQGKVAGQLSEAEWERFDLARIRPGTWTLRAHTPQGFRVRRFVVHQREGRAWVVEAQPPARRR